MEIEFIEDPAIELGKHKNRKYIIGRNKISTNDFEIPDKQINQWEYIGRTKS